MKTLLQNALIIFALALCGLVAFQWHRETRLRQEIQSLNDTLHSKLEVLQNQQGILKQNDEEIKRLDALKQELTGMVKSNRLEIAKLSDDLERSEGAGQQGRETLQKYKTALEEANARITKQNEAVSKQNENLKKLAADHAAMAAKYNQLVTEFNELARKWNEAQAGATNASPKQ